MEEPAPPWVDTYVIERSDLVTNDEIEPTSRFFKQSSILFKVLTSVLASIRQLDDEILGEPARTEDLKNEMLNE